eukprot:9339582-Pyramimonas_sp.AAC.2
MVPMLVCVGLRVLLISPECYGFCFNLAVVVSGPGRVRPRRATHLCQLVDLCQASLQARGRLRAPTRPVLYTLGRERERFEWSRYMHAQVGPP